MAVGTTARTGAGAAGASQQPPAGERRLFLIDGPSLVYRAFYALPESIATSTGEPTNAIFGFASMLVKIVTEYGVCPTLVVWDAGTSGRSEVFAEYKAQRRSRPDLLKQQWPAMEPLVEAFGYGNVRVEGYEADDVIASLAARATGSEPPVPVMIVTGDRDALQLVDEPGLVKVMATSRGITETKVYDRQAVIDRYGIPPELIPDFYGLKGDTSDNIPGVPGIGEKTAGELIRAHGTLEGVLSHIEDISGPKRKQNLLEHADDARLSKQLATVQRDIDVEVDLAAEAAREPDRALVREFFRRYELRDPLRRLEEALGDPDLAAPAPTAEVTLTARLREGSVADLAALAGDAELAVLAAEREAPDGELFAEGRPWRFAVAHDGEVLTGECESSEELVAKCGERPVTAHDAKALGMVPPRLVHDTLLGAYLLEPARRGYPFEELAEERGLGSALEDPLAGGALMLGALADWQREQIAERGLERVMEEIELPLVSVLRDMELLGVRLNLERLGAITERVRAELAELETEIFELAGTEFLIASPQQLGEVLFEKLGLSRKRRGKTGFSTDARVLQAIRSEHPIVPKVERFRELSTLVKTYLDVLPEMVDADLASTPPTCRRWRRRGACRAPTRTCRTSPSGPRSAARSGAASRPRRDTADQRRLLPDRAAGACPRGRGGRADGDLRPRRGCPHRHGLARLRRRARGHRPRHALEGEDDQLRDRLRALRLRPGGSPEHPPRGGEGVHRHLPRALPARSRASWWRPSNGPASRAKCAPCGAASARSPSCGRATTRCARQGERLAVNTVMQGTAADIIKLAMVRAHRALARSGLQTRLMLTIHDELLFEGPPSENADARELIEREMVAVWEPREPPLAVDIGQGATWLDAK